MNKMKKTNFFAVNSFCNKNISFPLFLGVILLAVLFGLDIATTNMILLLGGYEQNVIMALVINHPVIHIMIKGAAIVLITLIVQYSECKIKGSGLVALLIVILLYSYVIFNNVMVMKGIVGL